jgi:hypothetical protein
VVRGEAEAEKMRAVSRGLGGLTAEAGSSQSSGYFLIKLLYSATSAPPWCNLRIAPELKNHYSITPIFHYSNLFR